MQHQIRPGLEAPRGAQSLALPVGGRCQPAIPAGDVSDGQAGPQPLHGGHEVRSGVARPHKVPRLMTIGQPYAHGNVTGICRERKSVRSLCCQIRRLFEDRTLFFFQKSHRAFKIKSFSSVTATTYYYS